MQMYFNRVYSLVKPALISGILAVTGCVGAVSKAEYEAARKNDAEVIRSLREELAETKNQYETSLADLRKLVTDRTSIDELIPKVGEAKKEILEQLEKDYNELTEKWKKERDALEKTRRTLVADLETQKRWFRQTAEPAIGKPEDAEGPSTGIYADRNKLSNHEARLENQKRAYHRLRQNLEYQRKVEEWSYGLYQEYSKLVDQRMTLLQNKLDALNSAKPEERAAALVSFEQNVANFERDIELLYQQQKEKRKEMPPRPDEEK